MIESELLISIWQTEHSLIDIQLSPMSARWRLLKDAQRRRMRWSSRLEYVCLHLHSWHVSSFVLCCFSSSPSRFRLSEVEWQEQIICLSLDTHLSFVEQWTSDYCRLLLWKAVCPNRRPSPANKDNDSKSKHFVFDANSSLGVNIDLMNKIKRCERAHYSCEQSKL